MDRLFATQGATDLLLQLDLVLEYEDMRRGTCGIQCHGKECEVVCSD